MEIYSNVLKYNTKLFEWLKSLPIKEGEKLQVIILPAGKTRNKSGKSCHDLAGSVKLYTDPFASATDIADWEAAK